MTHAEAFRVLGWSLKEDAVEHAQGAVGSKISELRGAMRPFRLCCAPLLCLGLCCFAQRTPCRTFVHGTFEEGTHTKQEVLSGKPEGVRVLRRGKSHVVTERATRMKVRYHVRWLDECTFQLFDRTVKRGVPDRAWTASDTITVRIVETWPLGFAYETLNTWDRTKGSGEMKMIVPEGGGMSFGL